MALILYLVHIQIKHTLASNISKLQDASFWQDSLIFWDYLKTHPEALDEYRKIKEEAAGNSVREYYTRKTLFINNVLDIVKKN